MIKLALTVKKDFNNIEYTSITNDVNLDNVYDSGELDVLFVDDILDLVPMEHRDGVFDSYISKVCLGGTIRVTGLNLPSLVRGLFNKNLKIEQFNKMIFPAKKQSVVDITTICEFLISRGFSIVRRDIVDCVYFVEGVNNG